MLISLALSPPPDSQTKVVRMRRRKRRSRRRSRRRSSQAALTMMPRVQVIEEINNYQQVPYVRSESVILISCFPSSPDSQSKAVRARVANRKSLTRLTTMFPNSHKIHRSRHSRWRSKAGGRTPAFKGRRNASFGIAISGNLCVCAAAASSFLLCHSDATSGIENLNVSSDKRTRHGGGAPVTDSGTDTVAHQSLKRCDRDIEVVSRKTITTIWCRSKAGKEYLVNVIWVGWNEAV